MTILLPCIPNFKMDIIILFHLVVQKEKIVMDKCHFFPPSCYGWTQFLVWSCYGQLPLGLSQKIEWKNIDYYNFYCFANQWHWTSWFNLGQHLISLQFNLALIYHHHPLFQFGLFFCQKLWVHILNSTIDF